MYGESVCFLLGINNYTARTDIEAAATSSNAKTRILRRLDQSTSNRLMTIGTGCVLVSEKDNFLTNAQALSNFFLTQRLWMPVIALGEAPSDSPEIRRQMGTFARITMPIANDELASVLKQAFECDAVGEFSPARLRGKMMQLTRREKQTIELFLQGNNTKVVAKSLAVTHQTVDKHRGRALRKLGVRTVVDLLNELHQTMLQSIGLNVGAAPQPSCDASWELPAFSGSPMLRVANSRSTDMCRDAS